MENIGKIGIWVRHSSIGAEAAHKLERLVDGASIMNVWTADVG